MSSPASRILPFISFHMSRFVSSLDDVQTLERSIASRITQKGSSADEIFWERAIGVLDANKETLGFQEQAGLVSAKVLERAIEWQQEMSANPGFDLPVQNETEYQNLRCAFLTNDELILDCQRELKDSIPAEKVQAIAQRIFNPDGDLRSRFLGAIRRETLLGFSSVCKALLGSEFPTEKTISVTPLVQGIINQIVEHSHERRVLEEFVSEEGKVSPKLFAQAMHVLVRNQHKEVVQVQMKFLSKEEKVNRAEYLLRLLVEYNKSDYSTWEILKEEKKYVERRNERLKNLQKSSSLIEGSIFGLLMKHSSEPEAEKVLPLSQDPEKILREKALLACKPIKESAV